jgi:hypothetical protein
VIPRVRSSHKRPRKAGQSQGDRLIVQPAWLCVVLTVGFAACSDDTGTLSPSVGGNGEAGAAGEALPSWGGDRLSGGGMSGSPDGGLSASSNEGGGGGIEPIPLGGTGVGIGGEHEGPNGGLGGLSGALGGAPDTTAGDAPGGSAAGGTGPVSSDWVGIVGVGQSLSVGVNGNPVLSTTQPYSNRKLSLGTLETTWPIDPMAAELSIVPLVEPLRTVTTKCCSQPYPTNIYGETYHTTMATQLSWLHLRDMGVDLVTVHTEAGQSATGIAGIKKNGSSNAYAASTFEVAAIKRLADEAGATYRVAAVVLTHGEADANLATYKDEIITLQADYDQDLRAITGQSEPIPMILSQQTVAARDGHATSTLAQSELANEHPDKFVCTGPKYQYHHTQDRLHLTNVQYGRLGAKYAQVFHQVATLGQPWRPLQPLSARVEAGVVTVEFQVPKPPLDWDETLGFPHTVNHTAWAAGRGFEVEDSLGEVPIVDVVIAGNSVDIVLGRDIAAPSFVRYAMTADVFAWGGGVPTGRLGQLHDSDDFRDVNAGVVPCLLTNGSTTVTRADGTAFVKRSPRDHVSSPDLPAGLADATIISAVATDGLSLTLSSPWLGATGVYTLDLRANQWNYALAFALPLP